MLPKNFLIGFPKSGSTSFYWLLRNLYLPVTNKEEDLSYVSENIREPSFESKLYNYKYIKDIRDKSLLSPKEFSKCVSIVHPGYIYIPNILNEIFKKDDNKAFIIQREIKSASISFLRHAYSWTQVSVSPNQLLKDLKKILKYTERKKINLFQNVSGNLDKILGPENLYLVPIFLDLQLIHKAYKEKYNFDLLDNCYIYKFEELISDKNYLINCLQEFGVENINILNRAELPNKNEKIIEPIVLMTNDNYKFVMISKKLDNEKYIPVSAKHVFYEPTNETIQELKKRVNYHKEFLDMTNEFQHELNSYNL